MRLSIEAVLDYKMEEPVDVLLTIEAAPLPDQILINDSLIVDGSGPLRTVMGEESIGRRTWMHAHGSWRATYKAVFDVQFGVRGKAWSLLAFVDNIMNDLTPEFTRYYGNFNPSTRNGEYISAPAKRSFGVRASKSF